MWREGLLEEAKALRVSVSCGEPEIQPDLRHCRGRVELNPKRTFWNWKFCFFGNRNRDRYFEFFGFR